MGAHFVSDMTLAVFAGILPYLKKEFALSSAESFVLLAICAVAANALQLPLGFFRKQATGLCFLPLGLLLAGGVACLGFLPVRGSFWLLAVVAVVINFGGAMVHLEGFRGTIGIKHFAPQISTPMFIVAGFFGTACGPLLGAVLVGNYGLKGLLWLLLGYWSIILFIMRSRIELAVGEKIAKTDKIRLNDNDPWSFPALFILACLVNCGTTFFNNLMPSLLSENGYSLQSAGFRTMLFMGGQRLVPLG